MMFWWLSFILALLFAVLIFWPLLREAGKLRIYFISIVLAIPFITLFIYQYAGTPEGIGVTGTPSGQLANSGNPASSDQITDLTQQLEQRLQESPEDLQGWLLLGRTYKTMQSYEQAETALAKAYQIAPDDPLVIVEFAEAKMFTSQNPVIGNDVIQMLDQALAINPDQQKALWLLGFAFTQTGDDTKAIEMWERLIELMDPSVGARDSVRTQIDLAKGRLGIEVKTGWPGLSVQVTLNDPTTVVPDGAVLYVILRNPDLPGPPLGVRRVDNPQFPVQLTLSDADSMMQEIPVSSVDKLQLLARLSFTGNPVASDKDPASDTVLINKGNSELTILELLVP